MRPACQLKRQEASISRNLQEEAACCRSSRCGAVERLRSAPGKQSRIHGWAWQMARIRQENLPRNWGEMRRRRTGGALLSGHRLFAAVVVWFLFPNGRIGLLDLPGPAAEKFDALLHELSVIFHFGYFSDRRRSSLRCQHTV